MVTKNFILPSCIFNYIQANEDKEIENRANSEDWNSNKIKATV